MLTTRGNQLLSLRKHDTAICSQIPAGEKDAAKRTCFRAMRVASPGARPSRWGNTSPAHPGVTYSKRDGGGVLRSRCPCSEPLKGFGEIVGSGVDNRKLIRAVLVNNLIRFKIVFPKIVFDRSKKYRFIATYYPPTLHPKSALCKTAPSGINWHSTSCFIRESFVAIDMAKLIMTLFVVNVSNKCAKCVSHCVRT